MASNKNALIRYKTIDNCLRKTYREWTLADLIEACSDALYEYEGKHENVSKRTVQLDIQLMRSDKLGYNAPIEVYDRKYYRYADDDYSIMNIPVTENDLQVMNEAVQILRQFKDFSLFSDMDGVLQRLEDSIYSSQGNQRSIIHLEKNEQLKGLNYLDELYQAILKKVVLKITYKSFKAQRSNEMIFHPYLLKEFNNRWFIIGSMRVKSGLKNLALDRIVSLDYDFELDYIDFELDADTYYKDVVGVTVMENQLVNKVKLWVDKHNAPYVVTKPMHHSQELIEKCEDGSIIFQVKIKINFEFERLILGYGNTMEVLSPLKLRNRIAKILKKGAERYGM